MAPIDQATDGSRSAISTSRKSPRRPVVGDETGGVNNNQIDPLLRLLEDFAPTAEQEATDVERVIALARAGDPWNRANPLHVTSSGIVVHPPTNRVLLRWHERQQAWLQIGGHGDPGETDPIDVALREGAEETGLSDLVAWPSAVLRHVVIVPVPANAREPAHEHADLRFFLATNHPDRAVPEKPTAALRWLSTDEAAELTTEANVRDTIHRVAAAMKR